ncbi:carboxypeptidase regulatory-like domain-containing protein [Almyronema epifaneia]|uniref:Carboxypeptidase regulatory-like domain-containing protein n=1 Tax=Almyronema epifaneia S1 TaxID=2991925 RepID=A0ABW6IG99_9CYAN
MKAKLLVPLAAIAVLGLPSSAFGHAVQTNYFVPLLAEPNDSARAVESSVSGDAASTLVLESTFGDGSPFVGAEVTVYAPNDPETPWGVGTTDESGQFAFVPDESMPGNWTVKIRQEGHGDIVTIPVGETGIDFQNISEGEKSDIHYGAISPIGLAALAALGGGSLAIARLRRQRQSF